jgi:hypothetical protein
MYPLLKLFIMSIKKCPLAVLLSSAFLFACNGNKTSADTAVLSDSAKLNSFEFTVEKAPEWDQLLYRNKGWFGGDGIFAVTKNGDEREGAAAKEETMIWFSDTMFGDIENDSLKPGYGMINNSIAILNGGKPDSLAIHFYWDSVNRKPASLFIPQTPATGPTDYYWLGDGFVNQEKNNDLYIFGYRIRNLPNVKMFGFREEGNTLIVVPAGSKPPFANKRQIDIPFLLHKSVDTVGSFGAGILVNTKEAGAVSPDGYVYVYGVRGKTKQVMVSRVKPKDIENFEAWRFWNGKDWTADINAIEPIADKASNELSVSPLPDGRYIMVFQHEGLGKFVGIRIGLTPFGPFGPVKEVYDVSDDLKDSPDFFPYNAKAHPVLSQPGELLISYNINSFKFDEDVKKFPHLYRPRFIKLKYKLDK